MKKRYKALILVVVIAAALAAIYNSKVIHKIYYPLKYEETIYSVSDEFELDPFLVMAVIRAESRFRSDVISSKEAKGLMQLTNETAESIADKAGVKDYTEDSLFVPEDNIRLGAWYLKWLLNEFNDSERLALASYNAGIGTVKKWLGNKSYSSDGFYLDSIPYGETDKFVKRVEGYKEQYKKLYG